MAVVSVSGLTEITTNISNIQAATSANLNTAATLTPSTNQISNANAANDRVNNGLRIQNSTVIGSESGRSEVDAPLPIDFSVTDRLLVINMLPCITPTFAPRTGLISEFGHNVIIGSDSDNRYRRWTVGGRDQRHTDIAGYGIAYVIDPGNTSDMRDESGTPPTLSSIISITPTTRRVDSTSPSVRQTWSWTGYMDPLTLVGGDGVDTDGVLEDFYTYERTNFTLPAMVIQNLGALWICNCILQVGDGSTATEFNDTTTKTIIFRQNVDVDSFHRTAIVRPNIFGLRFDLVSGDSVTLSNKVVQSSSPWKYDCAVASGATATFTNCSFKEAGTTVIDDVEQYTNCTFDGRNEITSNGSQVPKLDTCSVLNGADTRGIDIDDFTNVSDCTFSGNTNAIYVNASGVHILDGLSFSGNTFDIEYGNAGAATFRLINGSDTPTVTITGGGSYSITSPATIEITGLTGNENVYVEDSGGSQQDYQTSVSGTYSYPNGDSDTGTWKIVIKRPGYEPEIHTWNSQGAQTYSYAYTGVEKLQPDGSSMYAGSSSALVSINSVLGTPQLNIDIGDGSATAQEIFDEVEDYLVTAAGMAWVAQEDLDIAIATLNAGHFIFLQNSIRIRRATAPDANATVNAFVISAEGTVVDNTNGDVMFMAGASLGDVWDQLTASHTIASTFGELINDNVDAGISSRAPASEYDTEMARLDVDVSTRSSHTASDVTTDIDANSADLNQIQADIAALNDISVNDILDEVLTTHVTVDSVAVHIKNLLKVQKNKWEIVSNQMIMYDDNGTTPLYTFDLKDASDSPSMTDVFKREPV